MHHRHRCVGVGAVQSRVRSIVLSSARSAARDCWDARTGRGPSPPHTNTRLKAWPGRERGGVVSAAVRGVPRRCAQWQRYVRRLVDNGTSYPWSRAPQSAAAAPPCSDTWTRGTPCSPPSPCWPPAWPSPPPGTSTDSPSSSTRIPRMYSTALRLVYTLLQYVHPRTCCYIQDLSIVKLKCKKII